MPTDAKPLIMGTRSILAWQEEAKTQTRRLVRPQPDASDWVLRQLSDGRWRYGVHATEERVYWLAEVRQPYAVGDICWIREGLVRGPNAEVLYVADQELVDHIRTIWHWKRNKLPAMFCPRWACRHYARVVSARPERLQEINREDVIAEGTLIGLDPVVCRRPLFPLYLAWWSELHRKPGTRVQDNPMLWRYELEPADES